MTFNGLAAETTAQAPRIRPGLQSRPSVLAVFEALLDQRLRLFELSERTGFARRTVSDALRTLEALGLLSSMPDLTDTRHTWYWVAGPSEPDPGTVPRVEM